MSYDKHILSILTIAVLALSPVHAANTDDYSVPYGTTISSNGQYRSISTILEDNQGLIWFGTAGNGLFRFDGSNYLRYSTSEAGDGLLSKHINSVFIDSEGKMWVGTQKGVNLCDNKSNRFTTIPVEDANNYVIRVLEDRTGRILITTQTSVLSYDKESMSFKKNISIKERTFVDMIMGDDGSAWLVYDSFIDKYDRDFNFRGSFSSPAPIRSAMNDGSGNFFLRTRNGFLTFDISSGKYVPASDKLQNVDPSKVSFVGKFGTTSVIIVADGTHYYYNFANDRILSDADAEFPYNVPADKASLSHIFRSKSGSVWAVADNNSIVNLTADNSNPYRQLCKEFTDVSVREMYSDGQIVCFLNHGQELVTYDIQSRAIRRDNISDIIGQTNARRYTLYRTWTYDGFFIFSSNKVYEISSDGKGGYKLVRTYACPPNTTIFSITVDRRSTLWAGCQNSSNLFHASLEGSSKTVEFEEMPIDPGTSRVYISKLITLRNGNIVAGYTDIGLGILNPSTGKMEFAKLSDKYNQMYIYYMCEDAEGDIWVGTTDVGIMKYSPAKGTTEQRKEYEDTYISCITRDARNRILFVADNTIWSYDGTDGSYKKLWKLEKNHSLTSVRVFPLANDNLIINADGNLIPTDYYSILHQAIPNHFSVALADENGEVLNFFDKTTFEKDEVKIILPQTRNNLQLSFFTPKFTNYPVLFTYRLRKGSNDFSTSFNSPVINLSNLSYGRHKIDLKITDLEGSESSKVETVNIYIKRPWLISQAAMMIYILLVLVLLFTIMRLLLQIKEKKMEAESILREKELQSQLDNENIDFFANMSHELRTPLSIISAASETLAKDDPHTSSQLKLQKIIQRNSDRMLKLVSQMLDFNKLEHNKLPLSVVQTDIKPIISEIVGNFTPGAAQKGINLSIDGPDEPMTTWIDEDKFEKIIYNLLSNAIKFTPVNGSINVKYYASNDVASIFPDKKDSIDNGQYLVVEVADTGIGIPEDSLTYIFERFGQAFPSQKSGGTGIGLYFAKAMVELHHGFIKAGNKDGAVMTLAIPMSKDAYSEIERTAKPDQRQSIDRKNYLSEYTIHNDDIKQKSDFTVLVIDDDYEIINFLTTILQPFYKVVSSYDAMGGYKMIETENPDIIISDIMMAEMDGLQLCRMIKDDINICHIPLILLTAKDTVANQIEGLNCGANAYIVKPFDPAYLLAMIGSLLRNRDNVKQILNTKTEVDQTVSESISGKDKILLEQIYKLFEDNLSNTDVNAADFADECGISRTKFFYKVKSLTGMTPSDYFRTYRLNRAIELLKEDKYKISAIAQMCGFGSPSHFSALFKKQFGMLPSEYINK